MDGCVPTMSVRGASFGGLTGTLRTPGGFRVPVFSRAVRSSPRRSTALAASSSPWGRILRMETDRPWLHAVSPNGQGDVTSTRRLWTSREVGRVVGTPVLNGWAAVCGRPGWGGALSGCRDRCGRLEPRHESADLGLSAGGEGPIVRGKHRRRHDRVADGATEERVGLVSRWTRRSIHARRSSETRSIWPPQTGCT